MAKDPNETMPMTLVNALGTLIRGQAEVKTTLKALVEQTRLINGRVRDHATRITVLEHEEKDRSDADTRSGDRWTRVGLIVMGAVLALVGGALKAWAS